MVQRNKLRPIQTRRLREYFSTFYGDGSLKTIIDRNGVVAEYIYDIFGRKIEEKVGDSVVKYTYDNNNNILTITSSEGTLQEPMMS